MELIHGDCLEAMKTMESGSVDYALTSPPYNRKRNDKYDNYDDDVKDWFGWNVEVINSLLTVTRNHVFYNIQPNYYNRKDFYRLIGEFSESIVEVIVWEKSNPMPSSGHSLTNAVEYFLVMSPSGQSLKSSTTYTKNHITTSVNSEMPKDHKAVMKQEVCDWFFEKFIDGSVIDCFMGLGTTGISAKKYGVDFIGVEKSEAYFNKAVDRIKNAERLNDGIH